jgi:hypothetical protein
VLVIKAAGCRARFGSTSGVWKRSHPSTTPHLDSTALLSLGFPRSNRQRAAARTDGEGASAQRQLERSTGCATELPLPEVSPCSRSFKAARYWFPLPTGQGSMRIPIDRHAGGPIRGAADALRAFLEEIIEVPRRHFRLLLRRERP